VAGDLETHRTTGGSNWAPVPDAEGAAAPLPPAREALGTGEGHGGVTSYLLMDVAGAPLPALLPAPQLACLQEPGPGAARLRPGRPRVQLLEVGPVPKVFRS